MKSWYNSTKQERLEEWTPKRLLKKAGGKFPGKDYGIHCDFGGHPTPNGIRNLLHDIDPIVSPAIARFEILSHGYDAWRSAITAVYAMCERYGVDSVLALPHLLDETDAAWDHYSGIEKISETWARVRPVVLGTADSAS